MNTTTYSPENISDVNSCRLDTYYCSDKGLLLPLLNEYTWPIWWRAVLYFAGLLWCFLGIAIVADIFMCSIEKITSHTRKIKVASDDSLKGFEEVEVKIWNDTVANLTLMALGSSAPEILLACIETVGNGFVAGDLGPGTIVGSAAFNLFCITGLCVAVIPGGETRRIAGIKVFALTSIFSLFAYVWLVIVLVVVTPNVVEIWEAFMTFAFFPIMVILAYLTDQNCFRREYDEDVEAGKPLGYVNRLANFLPWNKKSKKGGSANEDRLRKIVKELKASHPELTDDELLKFATMKFADEQPKNPLWYRINATKQLGGNPKLISKVNKLDQTLKKAVKDQVSKKMAIVELAQTQSAILERDKKVVVTICRYGNMSNSVYCRLETIDGTAEATKDYIPIKMELVFGPKETEKSIDIEIIDDDIWEPDEVFFVKLTLAQDIIQDAVLGGKSIQEITILNDDEPGTFEFDKPSFVFKENIGFAEIPVSRSNGADGRITLQWKTEDISAIEGTDYTGRQGIIVFETGELKKNIEILIINDQVKEKDMSFKVILLGADSPGAKLGRLAKTVVNIVDDDNFNNLMTKVLGTLNVDVDMLKLETTTWSEQFRNAMNVNGGDIDNASAIDYVMHFLTFGWKIFFAFIPPTSIGGGWVSFFVSLGAIGLLTSIVGDLATIFGCLVGLKDSITAITFVAMGTSVPDLFASKQAATMEKTADNAIGNVTGSNSVNVFLGLGLPWMLASVYWYTQGKSFTVEAGTLSFSVVVFVALALTCIITLFVRRSCACLGRAELGGPKGTKLATALTFISIWFIYVLLSVLQAYKYIVVNF